MSGMDKAERLRREVLRLRLENAHLKNEVRRSYHEIHGLRAQLEYYTFMKGIEDGDD